MGASAGPNLAGIGRGGASNLVLEMDAHDAKSYPGEPTTNTLLNGYFPGTDTTTVTAGWTLHGTAAKTTYRPAAEEFFYKGLGLSNPRVFQINGGGSHADGSYTRCGMPNPTPGFSTGTATTVSFWYRFTGENAAQLSNQKIHVDLDYGLADVYANYTDYNDTEWHLFSATQTSSGSYAYYNLYIYAPALSACPGGSYFEIGAFQIEQKGYATPFVGGGQFARPASVNLMIHGDVGSGQTFSDSSPSKHTITAGGDVTHSNTQSKFSGGSIYFDSDGDYLSIPDSADWDFGNGDFTIDFWLGSPTDTGLWAEVIGQGWTSGSDSWVIGIDWQNNNKMRLAYTTNGSTDIYGAYTSVISTSGWTHYAFVRSGTTLTNYVNGVADGTHTIGTSTIYSSNKPLYIGQRQTSVGSFDYVGYMDEVRITKGTALWTAAFTPPTRRNLSAPVVDRSGNDNGGNFNTKETTDVATYRDGEVIEPIVSAVWDYDGTDDKISIVTDSVDVYCFTIAVQQDKEYTPDLAPGNSNVGFVMGGNTFNGVIMGSWTGTMTDETLSWWGYSSTPSTGSSATYIRDTITAGWHIFTFNWNGSDYDIWVDGTKRITYPRGDGSGHSGLFVGVTAITPGWSGSGWNNYFEGKMGFLRAYDKSLSDQQIIENFNQQSSRFNVPNWANNAIVQNGLDLWLDAGDRASYPGTGSTWYDLTSNNYNGTLANAVYSGYGNGSFAFDGSGDTVDVGPISTAGDHSNCTISIWMNKEQQTNYGNLYDCNYGATALNKGPRMEVDVAGSIVRVYMGSDGGNYVSISFGSLSNDEWYNLVLTVTPNGSSQDLKSYTDGALVSSYTSSSTYVWDGDVADLYLGVGFTAGRHFTGKIAAFELYNRVLSADEIAQNFIVQKQRFGK